LTGARLGHTLLHQGARLNIDLRHPKAAKMTALQSSGDPPAGYQAITRGIQVSVEPRFLPEQSDPDTGQYFWAYTVEIANHGSETVQLRSRHWKITDGFGRLQEVRGPGVVGEQPILNPGDSFRYTSGCPLETSDGMMSGIYWMETGPGQGFEVEIPAFSLDSPFTRRTVN
jgi:ApaG protein